MRMKNRYCRMGKSLLGAMCLLSTCGVTYSCSDDYDLDETQPNFLKESIYDELKANGRFTNVVKLIDDLEYANVLSRTGSKTLFVADDDAYARFYQNNNWGVSDYSQLTPAMKRLLLNGSMLNNAYVVDMLVNTSGGEEGKNKCLRQASAATALDTIPFWSYDQLPNNLNSMDESGNPLPEDESSNERVDSKFWKKFRDRGAGTGIYMALDKTQPMLTHFLEGQLNDRKIQISDVAFVLNQRDNVWTENRSYIYGNRIVKQDVTCMNGYYHVLDEVLVTPSNMAEMIRQNGSEEAYQADKTISTKYFSLLLERFSAPYYDRDLTQQYKALYDIPADSVYQKRYISNFSQGGKMVNDPEGNSLGDFPYLNFDPGWNEFATSTTTVKEADMGAIFAPSDEAMEKYFILGAGRTLMDRYAKLPNTEANLAYNLYQVPLDIVQALLRNLMKESFNETVPSKFLTIMNDAQDQMFSAYASEADYKANIKKCLLANNGVIYIMNGVVAPADYASVIAPSLYSKNTQVVKSVVRADDNFIDGTAYNDAPLQMYFSTYLKAMQSRFSFFVPVDEGLKEYGYVDPYSFGMTPSQMSVNRRCMAFSYSDDLRGAGKKIPVDMQAYKYSESAGAKTESLGMNLSSKASDLVSSGWGLVKKSLLVEMIDQHIVLHDNDDLEGIEGERKFYLSRSGAPVYVNKKAASLDQNGKGMEVMGGFQLMLNEDASTENDAQAVCTVIEGYNQTRELPANNNYGNGMTYFLDRPMQPTMKTVYNRLINNEKFSKFYDLCAALDEEGDPIAVAGLLEAAGLKTEGMSETDWTNEVNKYTIFANSDGYIAPKDEFLVRFFNNYRYTVYVPTNEALEKAIEKGLPTWSSIAQFITDNSGVTCGECAEDAELEGNVLCEHNQKKVQAMLTMLVNFIKYHFQDESLFVDNFSTPVEGSYQTSCIDHVDNVYLSTTVHQGNGTMKVTDVDGVSYDVVPELQNILARDMNFSRDPMAITMQTSTGYVKVSSYVTMHQINGALNFFDLNDSRYDAQWATPAQAKAFVAKYRIRK